MNDSKEIRIGPLFRVLAGLICFGGLLPVVSDPASSLEFYLSDWYFLLCFLLMMPLFIYCAVIGKVPDFIVRRLDEESYKEFMDVSPLFTKFNVTSITCALVFLTMVAFTIYRTSA
jgi:hypothetical protein